MNCCAFGSNGDALPPDDGGGAGFDVLAPEPVITTDATPQTLVVANLPVIGAGVFYYGSIRAQQDNGQRGLRFNFWTDASRNAIASNILTTGVVGPTGYTDVATPPWTNIGVPAGWGVVEANLVGNQVQILFGAAAGQNVEWRIVVQRLLLGGATP